MIKAVLFDMDGTITDTEKIYHKGWLQAFHEAGYTDYTPEDALLQRSLNHADACELWKPRYGNDFDFMTLRARCNEIFYEITDKTGIELKPGVHEILTYLHEKGIKSAVVTATHIDRANDRLGKVGLLGEFDTVISASMVEKGKPHPDVYLYACKELGLAPAECMAVEDSPNGVKSAYAAGCKTVMVPDQTPVTEDLRPMLYNWADRLDLIIPIIEKTK